MLIRSVNLEGESLFTSGSCVFCTTGRATGNTSFGREGFLLILRSGEWLTEDAKFFFFSNTFLKITLYDLQSSSSSSFDLRSVVSWVVASSSRSYFKSRELKGGRMVLDSGIMKCFEMLDCSGMFATFELTLDLCRTLCAFSKSSTRAHYLKARSVAFYIASFLSLNS